MDDPFEAELGLVFGARPYTEEKDEVCWLSELNLRGSWSGETDCGDDVVNLCWDELYGVKSHC